MGDSLFNLWDQETMKNEKNSFDSIQKFKVSAELIKKWSSLKVGDIDLRNYLEFEGISLWDVVAAHQAAYILPELIFWRGHRGRFSQFYQWKIKSYLRHFRDNLREFKERRSSKKAISPSEDGKIKIIFLSFEPRQVEVFTPVMDLLGNNSIEIKIIGSKYRPTKNRFFGGNREYLEVEDFFTKEIAKKVKENRKLLKKRWQTLQKDQNFKNEFKYQGVSLWNYLKDNFLNLFLHTFPQLIKQTEIANLISDVLKPDIIIGADDCDERARVYFLIGRQKKIPTLHIQYGVASATAVNWKFMSTDKAAIFDKNTYQVLTKMGLKGENLLIAGNPRFDRLIRKENTGSEIFRQLKINPDYKFVLFASQPNVADAFLSERFRREMIASVYHLVNSLKNTYLIVKPHPDENVKFHYYLKSKIKSDSIILVERDFNIQDLILACDLMMTFHSTTILEALIADKPVICIDFYNKFRFNDYVKKGVAIGVSSKGEIAPAINNVINNEAIRAKLRLARKNFLQYLPHKGRASEEIANLIFQMIKNV